MSGSSIPTVAAGISAPSSVWSTQGGIAQTPTNRPALTGGLQQMQMLHALRGGASMGQLEQMNPYTPRPALFLPPPLPQGDAFAQFQAQQQQQEAASKAPAAEPAPYIPSFGDGGIGPMGSNAERAGVTAGGGK
ncbi:hypothetical protein WG922_21615 [Ramlibacter sp. AN1015]|uniref:hypothetical protein n=1 Tax=Ramlibacter sp. AN1015 TaxID=3133428 RepID=UPI0030C031AA